MSLARTIRVLPVLLGLGLLLALPGGAFAAKPVLTRDSWNDPITDPNFCGSGLAVQGSTTGTGDVWIRFNKGVYSIFSDHIHGHDVLTGPNGATVTIDDNHHGHDANVVDNRNGTYTDYWTERGIIFKASFPDGSTIFDRGAITWKFIYGDSGTPGDPSDDYFISYEGVFSYAGQMPGEVGGADFCASAIAAFTA